MAARRYLFAVQDATGREVCSWTGEVAKVADVSTLVAHGEIAIQHLGETVAGPVQLPAGELVLHRWPMSNKLATPVSKPVVTA